MELLTRSDEARTRHGSFERIPGWFVGGWYLEFYRESQRRGVLADLEALPWNRPECVQVMLHDEGDDCFGPWMFQDGVLVEVSIPRTRRVHVPPPSWGKDSPDPGCLWRTDGPDAGALPAHSSEHEQDLRLSW
ncbi:hypothetical protein [Streptomyces sp. NBC_01637]|uniref:hypothetical protein n=1 Tax=unclassified Streptomyces TaxID=2593676 RepID=UPI00386708B1|nr:hypothetical protein OH719_41355 [Streptomyces sp. NBC_01653]WTD87109.1 hypothetical protein OG891_05515 [Streptomyces sp. NBC_01637]